MTNKNDDNFFYDHKNNEILSNDKKNTDIFLRHKKTMTRCPITVLVTTEKSMVKK